LVEVRKFDGQTTTSTQTTPSLSDEDLVELLALIAPGGYVRAESA
jgi:hypothetical protein